MEDSLYQYVKARKIRDCFASLAMTIVPD